MPLLDSKAPPEAKAYAAGLADARFALAREASHRPRIPARPLQRRGRVSLHGAELEPRDADRSGEMAGVKAYHRPHAQAAERRERLGEEGRALRRGAGAHQGGVIAALSVPRPHAGRSGRNALIARREACRVRAQLALLIRLHGDAQRLRNRPRAALRDERDAHVRLAQHLLAAAALLLQRDRGAFHLLAAPSRSSSTIVHPRGLEKIDRHRAHHEGEAGRFLLGRLEQRAMVRADQAQIVGAPALHEAQIVGVIDDAGEIGVLVIDPHRHRVAAVAQFAVEMRRCHAAVLARCGRNVDIAVQALRASGNTWSRVSGAS